MDKSGFFKLSGKKVVSIPAVSIMSAMEIWTIKKLLDWVSGYFAEKGVDSARLSAELLLGHVLGLERIQLYTLFARAVDPPKLAELRAMVKRAGEHEPVAYLVGRCEFYSLPLKITPDCLIPRPETEHLVEKAILFLRQREGTQQVLDLCTGSGCIAAAIAKNVGTAQRLRTSKNLTSPSVCNYFAATCSIRLLAV